MRRMLGGPLPQGSHSGDQLKRAPAFRLWTAAGIVFAASFVWGSLDAAIGLLPLIVLASAWLVASAASAGATLDKRVLSLSPLRFIGRISDGMYLWHPVALAAVAAIAIGPFRGIAATGLVMVMATASWFMVERRWLEVTKTKADLSSSEETRGPVRDRA